MTETEPKDVLVHASARDLAGKWAVNVASDERCYWRVSGTPKQTEAGRRIWFEDGGTIHAWGEIVEVTDGRIWFEAAYGTHLPCFDDAPTRGFTYIEPLLPRLDDAEWSNEPDGKISVEEPA